MKTTIPPNTPSAENVLLGWLGYEIPPPVKHRNKSRAAYRKTQAKRPRSKQRQLTLV